MKEREKEAFKELEIEEIINRKLAEMVGEHFKVKQKEEVHNELVSHNHPKPHHTKRPQTLKLEFDFEEKMNTIISTFGDESTAEAVIRSLQDSPVEIQVLARLILDLHERLDEILGE